MKEENTTKNPAENSAETAAAGTAARRRRSRRRPSGQSNETGARPGGAQNAEPGRQNNGQAGNVPQAGRPAAPKGTRNSANASQKAQPNGAHTRQNNGRPNRSANGAGQGARQAGKAARKPHESRSGGGHALRLLTVIVGAALVFAAASAIERWREARQVRSVMQLVCEELKTDREMTATICCELARDRRGIALLREAGGDCRRIPADSLEKYRFATERPADCVPQRAALELLRSSGTMARVGDNRLLLEVLECYALVERFCAETERYNRLKTRLLHGISAEAKAGTAADEWRAVTADPACAAFMQAADDCFGPEISGEEVAARIDRVLGLLGEKYGSGR